MFQDLVDKVVSEGYSLRFEVTPERTLISISDNGHRVVKSVTNLRDVQELTAFGLGFIQIHERKLARDLAEDEDDDPLEVEPVWLYYRVDINKSSPSRENLHVTLKIEGSDGRVMEGKYSSDDEDGMVAVCPGCGSKCCNVCSQFYIHQNELDHGQWLPLSAPFGNEYSLLPTNMQYPKYIKGLISP